MTTLEHQAFAKRVVHFYNNKCSKDLSSTCNHFMKEGKNRRTITRIISRYKQRGNIEFIKKTGRPSKISNDNVRRKIKNMIKIKPSTSVRNGARKLKIPKSTFGRIKLGLGIKAYKKQTVPKYKSGQKQRAKRGCRKIYKKIIPSGENKILIIDDETYVYFDPSQVNGDEYYHCENKDDVEICDKTKPKQKFPKKFLVWQAIDEFGNASDSFITTGTINKDIYLKECLKKRLLPFILKHHKIDDVLFWPDLASSHYANDVQDWLKLNKISYVPKKENPPNLPQARPIEKYWALCKAEYKRNNKQPKNLNSFKRIWKNCSKKVAQSSAQALMKTIRSKLRKIGYSGVDSSL